MKTAYLSIIFGAALVGGLPALANDTAPLVQVAQAHEHGAEAAAKGKGVVNAVDSAAHKINMSHEAIPSLGWPAMKMDFAVAPAVDLKALQPGTPVEFTVGKNAAGLPEIQSIQATKK